MKKLRLLLIAALALVLAVSVGILIRQNIQ